MSTSETSHTPTGERTVTGGCHCGRVRFEVRVPDDMRLLDCNCSICQKKGFLHLIVPRERFTLVSGDDAIVTYTFNTRVAKHMFCGTCGIHAHYIPRSHPDGIDVNARCLDLALEKLPWPVDHFDGRRWEDSVDSIR